MSRGNMPSVMAHSFSQVPQAQIPRSKFNRSHGYKTTFDAGYLVPIFVDEALPGDTFSCRMTTFARLNTPLVPVMDNIYCDAFFFAVPIRLIWENWERFNGAQDDPDDSTDFLVPQMVSTASTGYAVGSLHDYFGLPVGVAGKTHSSLWHRAYNLIWNEWFRDQNLQDSVVVDKDDGPDLPADYVLLRRGKRHDYFTSCLPWPQKGPAVELPLGTTAPVIKDTTVYPQFSSSGSGTPYASLHYANATTGLSLAAPASGTIANGSNLVWGDETGLQTDLSSATAATINALRQAFQIQKLYERDARGGTRYTEILRSHFGVTSPDARLQRPEYLGGGSTPVNLRSIPQTSEAGSTPQGNLAAEGQFSHHGVGFTKSFTEHCVLIGMISVRADLTYQQGLNRMWSRSTRWDFYWPALSHIGEQAVLKQEIYCDASATDDDVFGYQERYAEYRYKPSQVTGLFRSNASGSLDVWHLSEDFASVPTLDDTFIQDNPPIDRIVATPTEPHFKLDAFFNLITARPMPVFSVPGLIDHF